MPQPPTLQQDDELDPLPPLDGEEGDTPQPEEAEREFGELLEDDGREASLDDATAEDDPADAGELDIDEDDAGWLDEATDAPDLDLGDVAVVEFGDESSVLDEGDEPAAAVREEDFGFGGGPERGDLDAGDEGPVDADEDLEESELPALDADDDGELEDAALLDAGFAADEPLGLPWAAKPWSRVGAPVALAGATAVACAGRGAVVAGRWESGAVELLRVDLEGTWQGLAAEGVDAGEVRAVAVEGDLVVALVEGGTLMLSRDGGARFAPLASGLAAVDVAIASGFVWLRTHAGGLVRVDVARGSLERCPVPGAVAALARDAGDGIAALIVDAAGRSTALERGTAAGGVMREPVDAPEPHAVATLAVRGAHVAYAARRGGVARRLADGAWSTLAWEGRVTALAFVDDAGTLVAATYSDADDSTALVLVDPAGTRSIVARLGAARADAESDGRVAAMAYDDDRAVVWVAGGVGIAAFAAR